ncbi:hypothetical protein WICMUC_002107 [Wickerhamomyces mucosus]|uniref:DNA ligase n=1 Tax=Wickerhamomyces mucosus TaxID=1378264 RepID=A0A9P8TFC7_9ASCO|nr:hypothetical protein WICMUC_002107 [Wickerhamomyces mucosus]
MAGGQRDIFAMLSKKKDVKKQETSQKNEIKKDSPLTVSKPDNSDETKINNKLLSPNPSRPASPKRKVSQPTSPARKKTKIIDDEDEDISSKQNTVTSKPEPRSELEPTIQLEDNDAIEKSTSEGEVEDEGNTEVNDYEFDIEEEKKEFLTLSKLDSTQTKLSTKMEQNKPIPYAAVVEVFDKIESTTKRLEIIKYTSDFFLQVLQTNPDDLVQITYLFINRLGPDYEGLELGLGETILIKTISESTGKSTAQVKSKYRETGDLGLIALQARSVQPTMFKPKPLTVSTVFNNLKDIATASGKDSQSKKINIIKRMLTASQGLEAKFLIRSLESKLRIGLAEKTVLISLAKALVTFQNKKVSTDLFVKAEEKIRDAFCQVPNYEVIVKTAIEYGVLELDKHCTLKPGIPLKPMLAKPTKSITEVLDKFTGEDFTCEYKYDGERAQVHLLNDGNVRVYSRNSEDMSQRYPDIIDAVKGFLKSNVGTTSLILDCEAVAWSRDENKILPFQVLTTRKRKDVDIKDIKVQVCLFAFDILCLNDEPVIYKPLKERRELLYKTLQEVPGKFQFATSKNTSDMEELQQFLDQSVKDSCEGLMVKTLDNDPYRPSQRSNSWLKLKKDYLAGVGDSLDLIVIGAYYGRGKRTGTYGGFLLGSYNQDSEEIETCCKIGTGFSDEILKTLYEKLSKTEIDISKPYVKYDSSAEPDVWFEPTLLFEVLTADLSLSPVYKAGSSIYGRGISLRFPRFIRLRDDKNIEDATSSEQVIDFYERQAHRQ